MIRGAPALLEALGEWHLVSSVLIFSLKVQQHGRSETSLALARSSVFSGLSRPILYKSSQIPPVHCKHRASGGWEWEGGGPSFIYFILGNLGCQLWTFWKYFVLLFLPIKEKPCLFCLLPWRYVDVILLYFSVWKVWYFQDAGQYKCRVDYHLQQTSFQLLDLSVIVLPKAPVIYYNNQLGKDCSQINHNHPICQPSLKTIR